MEEVSLEKQAEDHEETCMSYQQAEFSFGDQKPTKCKQEGEGG